jgi:hypothetical protein
MAINDDAEVLAERTRRVADVSWQPLSCGKFGQLWQVVFEFAQLLR